MDKKNIHMLSIRAPPQNERYTQTKSKGVEIGVSYKWKGGKKL